MVVIVASHAGHFKVEEKHGDYIKKWLLGMYHLRVFLIQFSICCIIFYRVVESSNLKQRQKTEATEINMRDLWLLLHTHIHIPLMLPVNRTIVINDNLIFVFLFMICVGVVFMCYIVWPHNSHHRFSVK